jgi:hypothetical protein
MNAPLNTIQNSTEFQVPQRSSRNAHHTDWSFVPIAAGGLTGVAIGAALGTLLGWC